MAESKKAKTSTSSSLATRYRKARNSTQFKLRTAAKLEDYLDSAQLSQVSAKLSRAKKVPEAATRSQMKEVRDFECLINKLKVLVDSDKEMVNLKDGSGVEACTPFQRFEQIATRHFKGQGSQNTRLLYFKRMCYPHTSFHFSHTL
ncbi:pentatricopeptide repeat-containing protein [Pyrus ussuriensis x Pyrus communis]|uniref:Pentatricopeptide repeat-containing protein n=1 Tax=Pyrus ussuriensis x Pyrus communis TaxID=2448454 RepID=A0A5N5HSD3_9ROSA|nr:pentatricopeptide repeat-containing protein [Pyrus ussuriensis x Pyrus communis]